MITFNAITPLWGEMPLQEQQVEVKQETPLLTFADIFRNTLRSVQETQQEAVNAEYLLSTGQLDNPAYATLAITKAELSTQMLAQLRNRALDAYSELMRISM